MKRIYDTRIIDRYKQKTAIADLFTGEIDSLLELFLCFQDEYLLYEGEHSDYIYFLAEGELKIYSSVGNGRYYAHGNFPTFRVVGETSCLWGDPPMATVQCTEDCYCFGVSLSRHRETLLGDVQFLRYTCEILRTQMTALRDDSRNLFFFPLEARLASLLLRKSVDGMFTGKLVDCAEALSTSYRHLLRVIKSLCQQGVLVKEGSKTYVIADRRRLEELANPCAPMEDYVRL